MIVVFSRGVDDDGRSLPLLYTVALHLSLKLLPFLNSKTTALDTMISASRFLTCLLIVAASALSTEAFVNKVAVTHPALVSSTAPSLSNTALSERRWNFNDGQSPWGLKKNAEIWNGRVSQMAFVWVFLQELITGKGVFKGLDEGDIFFQANAVLFGVCVVGLTGWLALKGDDDYTRDA